jgi:alkylated DNA repair dioxygenase AlkB
MSYRVGEIAMRSWIGWDPEFFSAVDAELWFARLREGTAWEQLPIQVFGKAVLQPRLMAWGGTEAYRYSGLTLGPRPLDPAGEELLRRVSETAGVLFNHVVFNLYRDGADHIGRHADDERELGYEPVIASLSFGAVRTFKFEPKDRRSRKRAVTMRLVPGSLLVMGGAFQHRFYHSVPKEVGAGPRINVTFRRVLGPPGYKPPVDRPRT